MNQLLIWLNAYNSRHSLLEGGARLITYDDGSATLEYGGEAIVSFDLFDEEAVRDYLLNQ